MAASDRDVTAELLRTRDRLHALETDVATVKLRQDLTIARVDDLEPRVDALASANEIADAVARKMESLGPVLRLNWVTKAIAVSIAVLTLLSLGFQLAARFV